MKKLILLLLFIPLVSFGQGLEKEKLKPIPFVITNALGYGVSVLAGFGLTAGMLGHI